MEEFMGLHVEFPSSTWNSIVFHGNTMVLHGKTMVPLVSHGSFHGFRYGVFMECMKSYGILLKYHGIPWKLHWVSIETP